MSNRICDLCDAEEDPELMVKGWRDMCRSCAAREARCAMLRATAEDDLPKFDGTLDFDDDIDTDRAAGAQTEPAEPTEEEVAAAAVASREDGIAVELQEAVHAAQSMERPVSMEHCKVGLYNRRTGRLISTFPTVRDFVHQSLWHLTAQKAHSFCAAHKMVSGKFALLQGAASLKDDLRHWINSAEREVPINAVAAGIRTGTGLPFPQFAPHVRTSGQVITTQDGQLQSVPPQAGNFSKFIADLSTVFIQAGDEGIAEAVQSLHQYTQKLKQFDAILNAGRQFMEVRADAIRKHAHYTLLGASYADDDATAQAVAETVAQCAVIDKQLVDLFLGSRGHTLGFEAC